MNRKTTLSATLVEGMFADCGVALRPGRAESIATLLGAAVGSLRTVAGKLPLEREPGLFPAGMQASRGRKK